MSFLNVPVLSTRMQRLLRRDVSPVASSVDQRTGSSCRQRGTGALAGEEQAPRRPAITWSRDPSSFREGHAARCSRHVLRPWEQEPAALCTRHALRQRSGCSLIAQDVLIDTLTVDPAQTFADQHAINKTHPRAEQSAGVAPISIDKY